MISVTIGAMAAALIVGSATIPEARIATIRANGGYVLLDNRTRHGVLAVTGDLQGKHCDTKRPIRAGNRGRVRACGAWSYLWVQGPGGEPETARLLVARGRVYQVLWNGTLTVEPHDAY